MGEFDPGLFVWALLTFAALVALLARFAFKPLREALSQREAAIRQSLDEARTAREQAQEILKQNQAQLDEARTEARRIIDEGNRLVVEMRREGQTQAKQEADALVDRAKGEIERETQRSLADLKDTVAGLSVRIARQVIREGLDEKRHEELADSFIERLKKNYAARSRT